MSNKYYHYYCANFEDMFVCLCLINNNCLYASLSNQTALQSLLRYFNCRTQ